MRTIALLSFKEILYKRIFLIAMLATIVYLAVFAAANHFGGKEIAQDFTGAQNTAEQLQLTFMSTTILTMGLYFSSFITALLAILSTIGSISGEIESHQIDTLLARPLRRSEVVFGKFLGLGGLIVCYAIFLFSSVLLINQFFGGVITVDIALTSAIKSGFFFALQPLVIVAVSLWLGSRMSTVNGGVILIILYVIAFIGGFIEQLGVVFDKLALQNIGILSSLLFPTDSLFRKMTQTLVSSEDNPIAFASQGPFATMSEPNSMMIGYAIVYALLALFFAARKFSKRDV